MKPEMRKALQALNEPWDIDLMPYVPRIIIAYKRLLKAANRNPDADVMASFNALWQPFGDME